MANIAVIGGGLFGSVAAQRLSSAGHSVVIHERRSNLLDDASANKTNRLHLGFHYPRDMATAAQSSLSSTSFEQAFSFAARKDLDNYYALASEDSKTNVEDYVAFLDSLGEDFRSVQEPPPLRDSQFPFDKVDGLWVTREGITSIDALTEQLHASLLSQSVDLRLNNTVVAVNQSGSQWRVEGADGLKIFDAVVMATYRVPIPHSPVGECSCSALKKFQLTLVLELSSPAPAFGHTILDGDFLTLLPCERSNSFLLYTPGPSVLRTLEATDYAETFAVASAQEIKSAEEALLERLDSWLPKFRVVSLVSRRTTVRTLMSGVEDTDARPSRLIEHGPGFLELWSGKLDHSVSIANELLGK